MSEFEYTCPKCGHGNNSKILALIHKDHCKVNNFIEQSHLNMNKHIHSTNKLTNQTNKLK